jgi:N-acetylglucosaminyldiphosphoundecaprenol N-acetyl-beta-D-mannosaminyltransferase
VKTAKVNVLGVDFDAVTPADAVSRAEEILAEPRGESARYVVTPNPEIVRLARRSPEYRNALNAAALVLPDGIGVIYAAKILKKPLRTRVTGIDFASELLGRCAERGFSAFLFGAKPGVAETAAARLAERYPGIVIAGTADGYFADADARATAINAASPDLLLVCLGAPKQELFMAKYAAELNAKLAVGLGGALDLFAGNVRRAPRLMRKLGLEWLYRLAKQPSRIGRMAKLPLFLLGALRERIRKK